jgi:hypothetical protein
MIYSPVERAGVCNLYHRSTHYVVFEVFLLGLPLSPRPNVPPQLRILDMLFAHSLSSSSSAALSGAWAEVRIQPPPHRQQQQLVARFVVPRFVNDRELWTYAD